MEPNRRPRGPLKVLGLDLAGSPGRPTGCGFLHGPSDLRSSVAYSDLELRELVATTQPHLIIIDAPLSLPRGRRTIDDRSGPHLRECDRELLRRRIRFFPLTLGPMRMLTERGMRLAAEFRDLGYPVVEGYPGAAQDLLAIPRKKAGVAPLRRGLLGLGLLGDLRKRSLTHDELDAATIAWVGRRYLAHRTLVIGDPAEGLMVLPHPRVARPAALRRTPPTPRTRRTRR
jgi:predicted nuclease with RNAse H fold